MSTINPNLGRLPAGLGSLLLSAALFIPSAAVATGAGDFRVRSVFPALPESRPVP
jgi:hypothetical protein